MPAQGTSWVEVLSALLTPAIALIALFIAYQQYRVNQFRLRHELYERRLRVYKAVQSFLSDIVREGGTDYPRCAEFYREASEAVFLFEPSVQEYIEEIYSKAIDLVAAKERLYPPDGSPGLPVGDERTQVSQAKADLLKWLVKQLSASKELFRAKMGVT